MFILYLLEFIKKNIVLTRVEIIREKVRINVSNNIINLYMYIHIYIYI